MFTVLLSAVVLSTLECSSFTLQGFAMRGLETSYSLQSGTGPNARYTSASLGYHIYYCDAQRLWCLSTFESKCLCLAHWSGESDFSPNMNVIDTNWREKKSWTHTYDKNTEGNWVRRAIVLECFRSVSEIVITMDSVGSPQLSASKTAIDLVESTFNYYTDKQINITTVSVKGLQTARQSVSLSVSIIGQLHSTIEIFGEALSNLTAIAPAAKINEYWSVVSIESLPPTEYPSRQVVPPAPTSEPVPHPTAEPSSTGTNVWVIALIVCGSCVGVTFVFVVCCVLSTSNKRKLVTEEMATRQVKREVVGKGEVQPDNKKYQVNENPLPEALKKKIDEMAPPEEAEREMSEYDEVLQSCDSNPQSPIQTSQATRSEFSVPHKIALQCTGMRVDDYQLLCSTHRSEPQWLGSSLTIFTDSSGRWKVGKIDSATGAEQGVLKSTDPHNGVLPHEIASWLRAPTKPNSRDWEIEDGFSAQATYPTWERNVTVTRTGDIISPAFGVYEYLGQQRSQPCWVLNKDPSMKLSVNTSQRWCVSTQVGDGLGKIYFTSNTLAKTRNFELMPYEVDWDDYPISVTRGGQTDDNDITIDVDNDKIETHIYVTCPAQGLDSNVFVASSDGSLWHSKMSSHVLFTDKSGGWRLGNPSTGQGSLKTTEPHSGSHPTSMTWLRAPIGNEKSWVTDNTISVTRTPITVDYAYTVKSTVIPDVNGTYLRKGIHNNSPLWSSPNCSIFSDSAGHWKIGDLASGTGHFKSHQPHRNNTIPHYINEWVRRPVNQSENDWMSASDIIVELVL